MSVGQPLRLCDEADQLGIASEVDRDVAIRRNVRRQFLRHAGCGFRTHRQFLQPVQ